MNPEEYCGNDLMQFAGFGNLLPFQVFSWTGTNLLGICSGGSGSAGGSSSSGTSGGSSGAGGANGMTYGPFIPLAPSPPPSFGAACSQACKNFHGDGYCNDGTERGA